VSIKKNEQTEEEFNMSLELVFISMDVDGNGFINELELCFS